MEHGLQPSAVQRNVEAHSSANCSNAQQRAHKRHGHYFLSEQAQQFYAAAAKM